MLLEVADLVAGYEHEVLHGISFGVGEGELAVLFGLNGAGKTTTVTTIAGLRSPWSGSIRLAGDDIGGVPASALVSRGLSLSPEGRRLFPRLTVSENLRMGNWVKRGEAAAFSTQRDLVYTYFPRLAERAEQVAGTLSGGEQQMLAIGRALMSAPRLLIIDEASLGLSPALAMVVFEVCRKICDDGTTVLIVEQNVGILAHADRALIMEQGTLVFDGVGDEIHNANLRETYLGS